ncbi:hypothetical protein F4780DRAFT_669738 [Xylariomycetidae sp. FL0641]|nr:hypothetical protein F4780DRAFT_669738 [Xylariomycetidae sp. FL0641]
MATSQSENGHYPVHIGIWTNWSRGRILGSTLTLERKDADLLIAFTAFFIAFVSGCIWRIVCFGFHRHYATASPQGAVYHQQQAILRNSADPGTGIRLFSHLLWLARGKRRRMKTFAVAVAAVACSAAFAVASGFSSSISTAIGTEVLIESSNCGYANVTRWPMKDISILAPIKSKAINNALNYAQQCYTNDSSGTLDCGRFVRKQVPAQTNQQADCPFEEVLCRTKSENLRVDTGYMNSNDDFGLNAPPGERMLARHVLHCAPLATAGFSSQRNSSSGNITVYHYGNLTTLDGLTDYMATAKSIESQYSYLLANDTLETGANFHIDVIQATIERGKVIAGTSDFYPSDFLFRPDADTTVVLLAGNGVVYTNPSDDEWYRVSSQEFSPALVSANSTASFPYYPPLEPASPLGCIVQHQFCRKSTDNCGPLTNFQDAAAGAAPFFDTTYDTLYDTTYDDLSGSNPANIARITSINPSAARFHYLLGVLGMGSVSAPENILAQLGLPFLASQSSWSSGYQGPLSPNQWQLDVLHWSDIMRASIQASFLDTVYRATPSDQSQFKYWQLFESSTELSLCKNQRMKSSSHGSFSLFGLVFTYGVGVLAILTSWLLEPVSELLYRRLGFKKYAHLEWTANSTLQLQRLAHEGLGFGSWLKGTGAIPVTGPADLLGCLDLENPEHPVIHQYLPEPNSSKESQASCESLQGPTEPTVETTPAANNSDNPDAVCSVANSTPEKDHESMERPWRHTTA